MKIEKTPISFTKAINLAKDYIAKYPNGVLSEIGYADGHIQATDGYKMISIYTGGGSGPKHLDFEKLLNVKFEKTETIELINIKSAIASIKKSVRINDDLIISFNEKTATIKNRYGSNHDFETTVKIEIPILSGVTVNLSYFMTALKSFNAIDANQIVIKYNSPLSMLVFATPTESMRVGLMPIKP